MNNAVVTFNFLGAEPISNLTFPIMKKYADKIGADFEVVDQKDFKTLPKFHLYFLFLKYKRIICFNPNVLIRDDCPNLFDVVNEREIGLYDEGAVQPRYEHMYLYCKITQNMINEKKWTKEFYNLGVIVASRIHKELFKPPQQTADTPLFDQACITQRIFNNDSIKVHGLDYKLNRLPFLDQLVGQSRLDSYILQYESNNLAEIFEVMRRDIVTWSQDAPNYKYQKRIVFKVGGGMGDQLCAEPTIRYSMDKLFQDAEINVITHWPELFIHLVEKGVKVYKDDSYLKTTNLRDNPVRVLETMPDTKELIWQVIPHTICHGVDFSSMAAIHRLIPDEYKQFKMGMTMEAMVELLEIFGVNETRDYILVHPGKGWDSKTFPKEWWNKVIKGLADSGEKVAVIGKYISKKQGYVDVDIPDGVLDLRDILSVQAMFLLIGQAKMVISNDSAPVHVAGAFDNWILLIPTCKHPDNVLPYRNGNKSYKTCSLYKKLTVDYIDSSPTRLSSQTLDWVEGDILDYLPEPEDVVKKACEISKSIFEGSEGHICECKQYFIHNNGKIEPSYELFNKEEKLIENITKETSERVIEECKEEFKCNCDQKNLNEITVPLIQKDSGFEIPEVNLNELLHECHCKEENKCEETDECCCLLNGINDLGIGEEKGECGVEGKLLTRDDVDENLEIISSKTITFDIEGYDGATIEIKKEE